MYSNEPVFNMMPLTDSPIYKVVVRLIAFYGNNQIFASGTGVVIVGNLIITAKHVIEDFERKASDYKSGSDTNLEIWAVRIENDGSYAVWNVINRWLCPYSDIAILNVKPYCENAARQALIIQCSLNILPPKIGEKMSGFGFKGKTGGSIKLNMGVRHIDIIDEPYATQGVVEEVYPDICDRVMCPFPCFRVNFRTESSMSGGPVFDNLGRLRGIISNGLDCGNNDHISHIATLWPMMATVIHANRGVNYPRDVPYPLIELVKNKFIHALGCEFFSINNDGIPIISSL